MNQHIKSLKKACEELGISYQEVGGSKVFLTVHSKTGPVYFIANEVPFNNHIVSRIVKDKGYTYELLADVVKMPKTLSFIDPDCEELFKPYLKHQTHEDIVDAAVEVFAFPFILKKNSGSQGVNVFRSHTRAEALSATQAIFNQHSAEYDHVMLAQENISVHREFRVTVFQKEVVLIYEKDFSQATFVGNLSPLHWEGARATIITDESLWQRIRTFVEPIFDKLDLQYGGLDVAIDSTDEMYLFEINATPAYNYLIESNGDRPLIELYKHMLRAL